MSQPLISTFFASPNNKATRKAKSQCAKPTSRPNRCPDVPEAKEDCRVEQQPSESAGNKEGLPRVVEKKNLFTHYSKSKLCKQLSVEH